MEAGQSEVEGYPQLHSEFNVNLEYMKPHQERKGKRQREKEKQFFGGWGVAMTGFYHVIMAGLKLSSAYLLSPGSEGESYPTRETL